MKDLILSITHTIFESSECSVIFINVAKLSCLIPVFEKSQVSLIASLNDEDVSEKYFYTSIPHKYSTAVLKIKCKKWRNTKNIVVKIFWITELILYQTQVK